MIVSNVVMPVTRGGLASSSAARIAGTTAPGTAPALLDLDLLLKAAHQTRLDASPGIDGVTGKVYMTTAQTRLPELLQELQGGSYGPRPVRRVLIPKGKGEHRALGVPCHEEKIVQWFQVMSLEPGFEAMFLSSSYGFRPEIGTIDACTKIRDILNDWQGAYVLDADIRKFFDTIDHGKLMGILKTMAVSKFHRRLIYRFLKAGVMVGKQLQRSTRGTPQGGVASPLLSNLYLHFVLDTWFSEVHQPTLAGKVELIRYADDFVILFEREAEARQTWKAVARRFREFRLTLHDDKTRLIDCHLDAVDARPIGLMPRQIRSFNFLGFNFEMIPGGGAPSRAKVKVTTSEITIKKAVHGWPLKVTRKLKDITDPAQEVPRLLRFIRTSVGGFLAYQDALSDHAGLELYLEQITPVIKDSLRKAKATSSDQDRLTSMLAVKNIPLLIKEARRRGRWHKDTHGNWRNCGLVPRRVVKMLGGARAPTRPPEGKIQRRSPEAAF